MHKYRLVAKKGEGTFSEVLKAQSIKNGKYVAIKCMKNHFDSLDQVNNLREIQALRRLSPHANIIKLLEVLYDQPTGRLALVFELMDMNIYELIRGRRHYVAEDRVKNYMYQLMKAMDHMHRNGIFHRDIKPENILIMDDCLKLADFGSCRGIYSKQPYTEYISTRWYRAPECLLTDGYYNYKMDMWGVGCVFFEILSLFPLFPGTNELDQIQKIHNILGTPPAELLAKMKKRSQHMDFNFPPKEGTGIAKLIPHVNPECTDLVTKLLSYNPDDRLSARQALRHPYFKELREAEKRQKALMTPEAGPHYTPPALPVAEPSGVDRRQQTLSSNGSDHEQDGAEMGRTVSDAGGPAGPVAAAAATTGLPSIMMPKPAVHVQQHLPVHAAAHPIDHHKDDEGSVADGTYRLPGLHAQNSSMSVDCLDEGTLPPIANLSLGKANMTSMAQTNRRAPYYNDKVAKPQVGPAGPGVGAAAAQAAGPNAAAVTRRQSLGQQGQKYNKAGVQGGAVLQQHKAVEAAGSTATYSKFKANKVAGANSKYISPYSLRQLAGKE